MDQHDKKTTVTNHDPQLEGSGAEATRIAYSAPRLVEYGSFFKLTQSGGIGGGDSMASSPACL